MENNQLAPVDIFNTITSSDFQTRANAFRKDWYRFYKKISKTDTPRVDGNGNEIVRKRPDNLLYIIEAFMKDRLNHYFPGWSWRRTSPIHLLGAEYVIADGELIIIDERLLAFGINPPYRYFAASGAARIQFKRDATHTPENLVDLDKNVKAANTNALKKAINQLTGIGDDIYGKRIEEEGAGSTDDIIANPEADANLKARMFGQYIAKRRLSFGEACKILKVNSLREITDYKQAKDTIEKALNKGGDVN